MTVLIGTILLFRTRRVKMSYGVKLALATPLYLVTGVYSGGEPQLKRAINVVGNLASIFWV